MFTVKTEVFETRKEAASFAKLSSSMFDGVFEVIFGGAVVASFKGGRKC